MNSPNFFNLLSQRDGEKVTYFYMFALFFSFGTSALIRYNSLVQIDNSYTRTKLGIVFQEDDARFKKPTIVSFIPPFDDTWNWAILSPVDQKSNDQIMCGDNVYLYSSFRDMFINTRYDEKLGKNIVFASRIPNGNYSIFTLECNKKEPFQTNIEFALQSVATKCYLYTDFSKHHPELDSAYYVNCSYISQKSIWSITEGLFILPKEKTQPTETSDEL